ncbi:MAG: TetR/AcrR family transcriptional regulator [Proteobacteria bacterium]|nr:TetR/AcrR family transcriptional regulator [Pseudomonadota bacterium]
MPLRERKKLKQRSDLLAAATGLFCDLGFERTRMEDIAAAADVSVATVYNYFPTKQQILLELVRTNALSSQEPSAEILKNPPADAVDAFMALMKIETGDIRGEPDKKLWRELLASMIRYQDSRAEIEELRSLFRNNLRRLTKVLMQRGNLNGDIDVEAVIDIAYAIFAYHFRQLVCLEPLSVQQSLRSIRRDLKALLDGHAA